VTSYQLELPPLPADFVVPDAIPVEDNRRLVVAVVEDDGGELGYGIAALPHGGPCDVRVHVAICRRGYSERYVVRAPSWLYPMDGGRYESRERLKLKPGDEVSILVRVRP
jgi:hypothetical protein